MANQRQCQHIKAAFSSLLPVPQLKIVMGAKFYDSAQISAHKKIRDYSAL